MKVLHISRTMGQGGAEKIVYQLCCDNEVSNVVASTGGVFVEHLKGKNIKNYFIPDIDKKNPILMIKTLLILNDIINKEKIDIIHSHHRMAAFYTSLLQFTHKKLRHIYTAHNIFFGKKILMRFALRKCKIIACGKTVKHNLVNEYRIDNKDIEIIYNAVDIPEYRQINRSFDSGQRPCIGTIGRLSEQKGIDVFIKAIGKVKESYPRILGVIVGDGEDKEILKNLTRNLELEDNIKFLGYRKDVFQLIKSFDFVVLCSRWEGFPLTPIETFSMKKTIIVSNIMNNLEIVVDGYNGRSFERDSYLDLAKKMIVLLDSNYRNKLEKNAYLSYKEKYSYPQFIEKYKKIYRGI